MNRPATLRNAWAFALFALAGCAGQDAATTPGTVAGGDPARGAAAIRDLGCGSCHTIPGIPGANGIVGPPLTRMPDRGYLGGILPNTPENMILWLLDPPKFDRATAMPKVNLTERTARDITAYLYAPP